MKKAKESGEWADLAAMDLASARFLVAMEPGPSRIICYLCQQSAEKMLKAFLVYRDIPPKKTHDLISLHKTCIEQEPEFSVLKEACADLNVYAVEARYPSSLELTSNDAEKAIRDAERIWHFVSLRLLDR